MAKSAGCTFNSTYDVVASYVRVCVGEWGTKNGIAFDGKVSIPVLETDYDGSEMIASLKAFGKFVIAECLAQFRHVKAAWMKAFIYMNDLTKPLYRHQLRDAFYRVATSWLISDGHYLSWERIVAALQLATGIVVTALGLQTAPRTLKVNRMRDIVHVCAQFFETYISKWLSENGGWESIILLKDILMRQRTQDIPWLMKPCANLPGEYSVGNIINQDTLSKCLPDSEISAHEEMLGKLQDPHDTDINRQTTRHVFYSESDREQRNEDFINCAGLKSGKYKSESGQNRSYADQHRRDIERHVKARERDPTDPLYVAFDFLNIE